MFTKNLKSKQFHPKILTKSVFCFCITLVFMLLRDRIKKKKNVSTVTMNSFSSNDKSVMGISCTK